MATVVGAPEATDGDETSNDVWNSVGSLPSYLDPSPGDRADPGILPDQSTPEMPGPMDLLSTVCLIGGGDLPGGAVCSVAVIAIGCG